MFDFWEIIIKDIFGIIKPKHIIEIGSDTGKTTISLLNYAKDNNAKVHVIDPFFKYDIHEFKKKFGPSVEFYPTLSLNALPKIQKSDAILIDGDHNWYTVFNELKLIEKMSIRNSTRFPFIFLHDIGWPYGRRDLYYNPENIPDAFRKPFKCLGMSPDSADLIQKGGLNAHLNNAIYENDQQNGVLTAIEDFLDESVLSLSFYQISGLHGLGILWDKQLSTHQEVIDRIKALAISDKISLLVDRLEESRLRFKIERDDVLIENKTLKGDVAAGQKRLSALSEENESVKATIAQLRAELVRNQEELEKLRQQHEEHQNLSRQALEQANNRFESLQKEALRLTSDIKKSSHAQNHLKKILRKIQSDYGAIKNSMRWKVGDSIVSKIEFFMGRRHQPKAMDHIEKMFQEATQIEQNYRGQGGFISPGTNSAVSITQPIIPIPLNSLAKVAYIVLNRNGAEHLRNFFRTFKDNIKYKNYEIIIVDHGSTDQSAEIAKEYQSKLTIKYIQLEKNYSFSHSNNYAAAQTDATYLVFINNDILFDGDPTEVLISRLCDGQVGMVGIKLVYPSTHCHSPGQIQHLGIKFHEDREYGFFRPVNATDFMGASLANQFGFYPAVTGAAMMCRKTDFQVIGGFFHEYNYGYEDVDLCLQFKRILEKDSLVEYSQCLIHDESATQKKDRSDEIQKRRMENIQILRRRHGHWIKRQVLFDILQARHFYSNKPLVMGFCVTEKGKGTKAGDYFTALELAGSCVDIFGCTATFLSRTEDDWYDTTGIDVLIVMLDNYDLSKIYNAKASLLKVAWVRNWHDRWAGREWFDRYDLYLCSSRAGLDYLSGRNVMGHVFPIAVNTERFHPISRMPKQKYHSDCCFTGSYWNANREITEFLDPAKMRWNFKVFGSGWENHPVFAKYSMGFVSYESLPEVYAATKIVIDDANHVTKPWGAANSRIFDALSAGVLVITNNRKASEEIFGGKLPVYQSSQELHALLDDYLTNENKRRVLTSELREDVLRNHTYLNRAVSLKKILKSFARSKLFIAIKVPVPDWSQAHEWGDYHFALALKRCFKQLGHSVRIDILPEWDREETLRDDVALVLRGLSYYEPKPGQVNLMWNISHPDKVADAEYEQYDHVFVASEIWQQKLSQRLTVPVSLLYQCTDSDLFFPETNPEVPEHELLFVGNSRKQYRRIVKDCIAMELPVAVYGSRWQGIIPEHYLKGEHIPNDTLRHYYSNSRFVLNDHWDTMRENGFISNRIFDAGACGCLVITDKVKGIEDLFGDCVIQYESASDLIDIIDFYTKNPEKRKQQCEKVRNIIHSRHTFRERAKTILQTAALLLPENVSPLENGSVVEKKTDQEEMKKYESPHVRKRRNMKISILGMGKSGTTALFYAIKQCLDKDTRLFFEPEDFYTACQQVLQAKSGLIKWLFGEFKDTFSEGLVQLDKTVLIVRDPRDILVSRLLYRVRDMGFVHDKQKYNRYLDLLRKKEREPQTVSVSQLFDFQDELDNGAHPYGNPKAFLGAKRQLLKFWEKHQQDVFCLKYEDFVRGDVTALSAYLECDIDHDISVDKQHRRVVRSKKSGNWREWFTPEDVAHLRPICSDLIDIFGYSESWDLDMPQRLDPAFGSDYVQRITDDVRKKKSAKG